MAPKAWSVACVVIQTGAAGTVGLAKVPDVAAAQVAEAEKAPDPVDLVVVVPVLAGIQAAQAQRVLEAMLSVASVPRSTSLCHVKRGPGRFPRNAHFRNGQKQC